MWDIKAETGWDGMMHVEARVLIRRTQWTVARRLPYGESGILLHPIALVSTLCATAIGSTGTARESGSNLILLLCQT